MQKLIEAIENSLSTSPPADDRVSVNLCLLCFCVSSGFFDVIIFPVSLALQILIGAIGHVPLHVVDHAALERKSKEECALILKQISIKLIASALENQQGRLIVQSDNTVPVF